MTHHLKVHPEPFQAIVEHRKKFEYREGVFNVGDKLFLLEHEESAYSGRFIECNVTYVQQVESCCIMSINPVVVVLEDNPDEFRREFKDYLKPFL